MADFRSARRLVAQYNQALNRLTDARESQRIGALRTLEAIGRADPGQRQGIVDVLCAYLRAPGSDEPVRRTAASILADRLRPNSADFWPGLSVDLSGAQLSDLDLSGCRIDGILRLDRAVLSGQARLRGIIAGAASMARLTCLDHAWFERSVFHGRVTLDGANFHGDAWFGEAMFGNWTSFAGADFAGHAWFGGCDFGAPVDFTHATFRRSAGFRGAVAHASVGLGGTTFLGPARVSRRGEGWNLIAPGWMVVVDEDNESVGRLLWIGHPELVEKPTGNPRLSCSAGHDRRPPARQHHDHRDHESRSQRAGEV
jgi:hypothetical protein